VGKTFIHFLVSSSPVHLRIIRHSKGMRGGISLQKHVLGVIRYTGGLVCEKDVEEMEGGQNEKGQQTDKPIGKKILTNFRLLWPGSAAVGSQKNVSKTSAHRGGEGVWGGQDVKRA